MHMKAITGPRHTQISCSKSSGLNANHSSSFEARARAILSHSYYTWEKGRHPISHTIICALSNLISARNQRLDKSGFRPVPQIPE